MLNVFPFKSVIQNVKLISTYFTNTGSSNLLLNFAAF